MKNLKIYNLYLRLTAIIKIIIKKFKFALEVCLNKKSANLNKTKLEMRNSICKYRNTLIISCCFSCIFINIYID